MKRLHFSPEPVELLTKRFPKALERLYDAESVQLGVQLPPSQSARQVFDFDDGLRLIVSREFWSERGKVLHLSASIKERTPLYEELRKKVKTVGTDAMEEHFRELAESRYQLLSGDTREFCFAGNSEEKGVPHWFLPIDD
jgi:hypothetical protein